MDQKEKFNQQMNLQRIAQEKQQQAIPLVEEKKEKELYPKKLSKRWRELTRKAMRSSSPYSHRSNLQDFVKALKAAKDDDSKISLLNFQILTNSLEAVSPDTLSLTDEEYIDFMAEVEKNIEIWSKEMSRIQSEVDIKIHKDYEMKQAALSNGNGGLKPVRGEA